MKALSCTNHRKAQLSCMTSHARLQARSTRTKTSVLEVEVARTKAVNGLGLSAWQSIPHPPKSQGRGTRTHALKCVTRQYLILISDPRTPAEIIVQNYNKNDFEVHDQCRHIKHTQAGKRYTYTRQNITPNCQTALHLHITKSNTVCYAICHLAEKCVLSTCCRESKCKRTRVGCWQSNAWVMAELNH